jgi:hypothetical protein
MMFVPAIQKHQSLHFHEENMQMFANAKRIETFSLRKIQKPEEPSNSVQEGLAHGEQTII